MSLPLALISIPSPFMILILITGTYLFLKLHPHMSHRSWAPFTSVKAETQSSGQAYCSLIAIIIRNRCLHASTSEDSLEICSAYLLRHADTSLTTDDLSMATVTCILECHANAPELSEGVMQSVSSGHFFEIRHPHLGHMWPKRSHAW